MKRLVSSFLAVILCLNATLVFKAGAISKEQVRDYAEKVLNSTKYGVGKAYNGTAWGLGKAWNGTKYYGSRIKKAIEDDLSATPIPRPTSTPMPTLTPEWTPTPEITPESTPEMVQVAQPEGEL